MTYHPAGVTLLPGASQERNASYKSHRTPESQGWRDSGRGPTALSSSFCLGPSCVGSSHLDLILGGESSFWGERMAPKHGVYKTLPTLSWGGGSRSQVKPFMLIPGAAGTRAFWFSTANGRGAGELRGRKVGSPTYAYPPMLRGPCAVAKNRGTNPLSDK